MPLHQLHEQCHSRIKYKKTCPIHGEVNKEEIVSGYEYADGQYVIIKPEELDQLRTETERAVNVDAVLPSGTVDSLYYSEKAYYLVPDGAAGQKPFVLIQQSLAQGKLEAVAKAVLFGREELVLVQPVENVLLMTALRYEAEVNHADLVADEVIAPQLSKEEVDLTKTLMKAFTKKRFSMAAYKDDYVDRLKELIEAKVEGRELVTPPETEQPQVINLMDALKKSVAQASDGTTSAASKPTRKMAPSVRQRRASGSSRKRKSG
jgi:DNA end-binding protein Ku